MRSEQEYITEYKTYYYDEYGMGPMLRQMRQAMEHLTLGDSSISNVITSVPPEVISMSSMLSI